MSIEDIRIRGAVNVSRTVAVEDQSCRGTVRREEAGEKMISAGHPALSNEPRAAHVF